MEGKPPPTPPKSASYTRNTLHSSTDHLPQEHCRREHHQQLESADGCWSILVVHPF
jgi:hypothetical protein